MYSSYSAAPYTIDEEDGNCVVIAPLGANTAPAPTTTTTAGSSSFHAGGHVPGRRYIDGQLFYDSRTPSLELPPYGAEAYPAQPPPLLVTTPRGRRISPSVRSSPSPPAPAPAVPSVLRPSPLPPHDAPHEERRAAESLPREGHAGRPPLPPLHTARLEAVAPAAGAAAVSLEVREGEGPPPVPMPVALQVLAAEVDDDDGPAQTVTGLPGLLGPLILVHRPRPRPPSPPEGEEAGWVAVTAAERAAGARELAALRARLDMANDAAAAAERRTAAEAESRAAAIVGERREEDRRRRQQMQGALDALREECASLTARLEAAQLHGAGDTDGPAAASPALQAQWARQLQEVEGYWRQRLRSATQHWESELDAAAAGRAALLEQVKGLVRALEDAQAELRRATGEAREREAECARLRLGLPPSTAAPRGTIAAACDGSAAVVVAATDRAGLQRENAQLRGEAAEHRRREEALLAQVESYAEENTRLQADHDHRLAALRRELERERGRNADLLALYGSQVQALHQQLKDAVSQRDQAVARLKHHNV